jgi:hypothetical protein
MLKTFACIYDNKRVIYACVMNSILIECVHYDDDSFEALAEVLNFRCCWQTHFQIICGSYEKNGNTKFSFILKIKVGSLFFD